MLSGDQLAAGEFCNYFHKRILREICSWNSGGSRIVLEVFSNSLLLELGCMCLPPQILKPR